MGWMPKIRLWATIKAFWRTIVAFSGFIGVLYLWADIEGLPVALTGPREALRGALGVITLQTALLWFSGALVLWILWRDVRPVLPLRWQERLGIKLAPARARAAERDRKWSEAVAFVANGKWDSEPWSGEDGYAEASLANSYLRQAAIDKHIRTWGRTYPNSGPHLPIESDHWMHHTVDFLELFKESASTSKYSVGASGDVYHGIMVSSVEVEAFAASLAESE